MHIKKWLMPLLITIALAGCEVTPVVEGDGVAGGNGAGQSTDAVETGGFEARHHELIATDIVSALIQVQELNPLTTTIQYTEPKSLFGKYLIDKLRTAGYGLQGVEGDLGAMYIAYQTRDIDNERRKIRDFVVDIAGINIRREYNVINDHAVPASLMYISGSNGLGNITLNENLFLQQGKGITFESGVELELPDASIVAAKKRDIGTDSTTEAVGGKDAIREARNKLLGRSNEEVVANKSRYKDLQRALIKFPDNSLNVGLQNKAALKRVLQGFNASTDALFIVSCGGDTGAQWQATDRSSRIKEELILYSVPIDLIVEEGCQVESYPGQKVEPRMAVLTHSRIDESRAIVSNKSSLEFPSKPLAMTIPYGAGGATDYQARIVTMIASEPKYLSQPIMIVNKPGQGGRAGWSWFAETATKTGYDIASYNVPHFIAQSIKFGTPYNIDTLEPIANWGADPAVLVVPRNSPFESVADLIRYARSKPGELTVSGAGKFVGHHIALLQLEKAANIKTNYISDKGGAAALQQVVDGEVQAGFNNMSDAFRRQSELRILAIADVSRHDVIPDVSTFNELGLDIDDSSVNYRGLMVPKGTPQAIVDRLSTAALEMFEDDTVVSRMKEGGSPLRVMDRDAVLNMWTERQAYLAQLLRGL